MSTSFCRSALVALALALGCKSGSGLAKPALKDLKQESRQERANKAPSSWHRYDPLERLPKVEGASTYRFIKGRDWPTFRIAIGPDPAWAPLILANEGYALGRIWTEADGS